MAGKKGILDGVHDHIDRYLGLAGEVRYTKGGAPGEKKDPRYSVRKAAKDLSGDSGETVPVGEGNLLSDLLEIIRSNWKAHGEVYRGKKRNWVLDKSLGINVKNDTPKNDTPEVVLERLIVLLLEKDWSQPTLFNQIAVCSGLMPEKADGNHIDIVRDCGGGEYEFIELKYRDGSKGSFGSHTPLFAAFEVVLYGLLFLHAMENQEKLLGGRALANAKKVQLTVLAPAGFYRYKVRGKGECDYQLGWLENRINEWLGSIAIPPRIPRMTFQFQKFTTEFVKNYSTALDVSLPKAIRSFRKIGLSSRGPVYGD